MSEVSRTWSPTVGSLLANLDRHLAESPSGSTELPVRDTPVGCHVGRDTTGRSWIRIDCEPSSVATDDRVGAVKFKVTPGGYQVSVAPTASRSVSASFLDEVVQLLKGGHEPADSGRAALQAWRDFLARPAGEPLSEKALIGLFGELEVLESILRLQGPLESWTGWNKDHNDFRLPGLVIEVKSTTSANYRRVQIHGLRQLDDPQDGSDLVLVLRRLEPSPEGRSVPDLIEALVRLGASRAVLLERLSNVHYSDQHHASYEAYKYVSEEIALRLIDEDHPRLVPSKLVRVDLSSIDEVNYELNLQGDPEADLSIELDELLAQRLGAR